MRAFFKYHFPFYFSLILIFVQSSLPSYVFPTVEIFNADKLVHMGVYGFLTAVCYISLIHQTSFPFLYKNPVFFSILISSIYGITDEIHQLFVPNRSGEIPDWIADLIGCIIMGIVLKFFLSRRFKLFNKNQLLYEKS